MTVIGIADRSILTVELDLLLLGLDEDDDVPLELDHLPGRLALDRVHLGGVRARLT